MLAQTEKRLDGPLRIRRTRYGDDVLVFQLAGELDLATTADAWRVIESALDEPETMIVVDLTELEFIGVKGVAFLYGLAAARHDEATLRLLPSVHEGVNRVLEMTGVGSAITIVVH